MMRRVDGGSMGAAQQVRRHNPAYLIFIADIGSARDRRQAADVLFTASNMLGHDNNASCLLIRLPVEPLIVFFKSFMEKASNS